MGLNYICHWGRFDWEPFEVLDIWHLILVYSGMNQAMAVLNIHFGLSKKCNSNPAIHPFPWLPHDRNHWNSYPSHSSDRSFFQCPPFLPLNYLQWTHFSVIHLTFSENRCLHRWHCVSLPPNCDPATFGCMLWISLQLQLKTEVTYTTVALWILDDSQRQ